LSKAEFGTYKLLLTLLTYLTFSNVGLTQYILFKLPKLFKEKVSINDTVSILHSYLIVIRPAFFFVFLFFFFKKYELNETVLSAEWLLFGLFFIFSGWNNLFQNIFRSSSRFDLLTNIRIISSLFYFFPLLYFYYTNLISIHTILLSNIFSAIFCLLYGMLKENSTFKFKVDFNRTFNAISFGLPITLNTLLFNLINTSTLWIISFYLDPENTGLYSFALLISTVFKVFPGIISNLLNPKAISYIDVNLLNVSKIKGFVAQSINTFIYTNFIFMLLSILVFKLIITYFFTDYNQAWLISICLITAEYILSLIQFQGNYLIIKGKTNLLILVNAFILIIHLSLAYIFTKLSFKISFLGIPVLISFILSNLLIQYLFYRETGVRRLFEKEKIYIFIKQFSACFIAGFLGLSLGGYLNPLMDFFIILISVSAFFTSIIKSYSNIIILNDLVN
jgi:O-antigen/teichoic acid export membrane protein